MSDRDARQTPPPPPKRCPGPGGNIRQRQGENNDIVEVRCCVLLMWVKDDVHDAEGKGPVLPVATWG